MSSFHDPSEPGHVRLPQEYGFRGTIGGATRADEAERIRTARDSLLRHHGLGKLIWTKTDEVWGSTDQKVRASGQ